MLFDAIKVKKEAGSSCVKSFYSLSVFPLFAKKVQICKIVSGDFADKVP